MHQPPGSSDHLVGLEQERRGNGEPEGLSRLKVDDQLELHRLLHREVSGLDSLEDFVHIGGGAVVQVRNTRPVGHEATILYILLQGIHGWQPVLGR
jgi:hypothetical protein